jgi:hypothetical protein
VQGLGPDFTTTQNASLSPGTSETASSISARTGVVPRVPMISALVISAPSQCDRLMTSWLETPGKKYLLPPENPTTSWGNTGPTTRVTSCSTTARFSRTLTDWWWKRPSDSSAIRSAPMVPTEAKVSGSHHSWLRTVAPG